MSPKPGRFAFAWSALLGFDIFISYRRSDGSAYAEKLWRDLKAAGITPFLDRDETPGGAQLTPSLVRALRRSRMLVVLLTPDVLDSEWVQQEVETFSKFKGRAIAPINIDNYIARHKLDGTRLARLKDYSWIEETRQGLETGVPSETVLTEIGKGFRKVRVRSISRLIVIAVMVALGIAAVAAFTEMRRAQGEAQVALAGQTAAQAELIRTQDNSQLDLAAALAFDSLQRSPSRQAEQIVRAALESLPILLASFQTKDAIGIAFAPDGKDILTLSRDNRGRNSRNAELHSLSGKPPRKLFACGQSEPCNIALTAGVAAVASARPEGGSTVRVVDLITGIARVTFSWGSMPATVITDASAEAIAAIDSAGKACVWRPASPGQPICVEGPANARWWLNDNGKLLASRFEDENDDENVTWRVWNTETGAEVDKTGGGLTMSQTGRYIAHTSRSTRIQVHDLEKGVTMPNLQHEDVVNDIAFNRDDRIMASSSGSNLRLWVFEGPGPDVPVATAISATHHSLRGFTADGLGLVTEAGRPLATDVLFWRIQVRDGRIDLVPRQRIHHQAQVYEVAAHKDGTTYATLDAKGEVRVWSTGDGNMADLILSEKPPSDEQPAQVCRDKGAWTARLRDLWPHSSGQTSPGAPAPKGTKTIDPCGVYFAVTSKGSGGRDPEFVTIYKSATRQELAKIAHSANVNSVAFSPAGRYVVTGGEDHAIKVWDLEDNRQVSSIEMETEVRRVRFSDDGRYIVAAGDKDAYDRFALVTYLWKTEDLLSAIDARQMRRLSRDEWTPFLGSRPPLTSRGAVR